MDDLEKQQGTSSRLHQALCIISKPLVYSNWSYNQEMLNSGKNWWFSVLCDLEIWQMTLKNMMTSSNGNIFCITGPLYGEFTGPSEFPTQRPVTLSFDVYFDPHLNKRLSKQWWGWWFETPSWSLWRQCNDNRAPLPCYFKLCTSFHTHRSNKLQYITLCASNSPDSKVRGANMGPIWGHQDPGGPHIGHMNFAIWDSTESVDAYIHMRTLVPDAGMKGRDK